jgi:hypothetical protein
MIERYEQQLVDLRFIEEDLLIEIEGAELSLIRIGQTGATKYFSYAEKKHAIRKERQIKAKAERSLARLREVDGFASIGFVEKQLAEMRNRAED